LRYGIFSLAYAAAPPPDHPWLFLLLPPLRHGPCLQSEWLLALVVTLLFSLTSLHDLSVSRRTVWVCRFTEDLQPLNREKCLPRDTSTDYLLFYAPLGPIERGGLLQEFFTLTPPRFRAQPSGRRWPFSTRDFWF